MPLYEYRCRSCQTVCSALRSVSDAAAPMACDACGQAAERIVSRPSVHRSRSSKVDRLDPRYDRMVDKAMAGTPNADPDRHLRRMKPLSDD